MKKDKKKIEDNALKIAEVSKGQSIKSRLQRYFLLISLSIILLMSVFSLVYFYNSTLNESTTMVRNKLLLADLFMKGKMKDTESLALNLSTHRSIQLGLELGSGSKITDYLDSIEQGAGNFRMSVFDSNGQLVTEGFSVSTGERDLMQKALQGNSVTEPCQISSSGSKTPAYVSAVPVLYNDDIIGVVMTEFVFVENQDFFAELSRNLECDLAIYTEVNTVISTGELPITSRLYKNIAYSGKTYEDISLTSSGLNEYKAITDSGDNPVALIRVYLGAFQYRNIFLMALIAYVILAVFFIIIVISLVLRISASILNPLDELLQGVNVVRGGDLTHEVNVDVQDEIGRLGSAFNELRAQLNDKITTIQDMNQSLEDKISERTATINTLNDKMKRYLSPQLYASIAGGERDASVDRYYRKKLTVFFSDVVNFTATTDSLEPEDLSGLLNSYLEHMATIALKYGGTIDKYVGDAIMVFFGDPEFTSDKDHALRAVKMAMEMQSYMISFREEWRKKGVENPFHVRVGINTGFCTIGNFGSETKMDYTIIGNNVNMAARFEAAAEPDSILMSPETYILVKDEIECVLAGEYSLKGITGTIKAYTPVRIKDAHAARMEFAKITQRGELIFPEKPLDLKMLSAAEKKELLISLRDAAREIIDVHSPAAAKPKVRSLDEDEGKAKKVGDK